jgi:hypothetical protein
MRRICANGDGVIEGWFVMPNAFAGAARGGAG